MKQTYLEKLRPLKERHGMYIGDGRYESIVSFIHGMDHMAEGEMLNGLHNWLRQKFDSKSPRASLYMIEDLYKERNVEAQNDFEAKLTFMFDLLFEFLGSKENSFSVN